MTSRTPAIVQLLALLSLFWLQSLPLLGARMFCQEVCEPAPTVALAGGDHCCGVPGTQLAPMQESSWECCTWQIQLRQLSRASVTTPAPVNWSPMPLTDLGSILDFSWANVAVGLPSAPAEPQPAPPDRVRQILGVQLL